MGSFDAQVVRKWSLNTGQEVQVYQNDIIRPESLPNSTLITDDDNFQPTAGCYLWRTQVGTFAHVGDGPRGWVTPLTLSADGKFVVLPGVNNAALIDVSETQRLNSLLSFEGKLRAACILNNKVLMINSAGGLFINKV